LSIGGARGEFAAGSGAAMRIAPLAFLLNPTIAQDRIRDV
jgi:ADP-ribosylglycohydrolase